VIGKQFFTAGDLQLANSGLSARRCFKFSFLAEAIKLLAVNGRQFITSGDLQLVKGLALGDDRQVEFFIYSKLFS
jgi:hypothetical protein